MDIFLRHELDVSGHSFSSSIPLILVMQEDRSFAPIFLRRWQRTDRHVLIHPAEKYCSGAKRE